MTGRSWLIVAVAAVIGIGAGVVIGAAAWAGAAHESSDMAMGHSSGHGSTSDMATALDEREFMEMMVPHHESAIEMAEIALETSGRTRVRALARAIVTSQEAEIAQMRARYRDWYGEELVGSTTGPHADMDMTELESATPAEFDRVFLRMMVPHHASAVTMADQVMMGEAREETEALASEIIAAQAREIGQMQQWRQLWYPPLG